MVGSFYDPELDEGCAFEELISFHGGLGGPQTRPFILYPERLPLPSEPIVGAAAVHAVSAGMEGHASRSGRDRGALRRAGGQPCVDLAACVAPSLQAREIGA